MIDPELAAAIQNSNLTDEDKIKLSDLLINLSNYDGQVKKDFLFFWQKY